MYSFMMVGPYPVPNMWFDHVTCWEILRLGLLSCWDVSAIPSHIHHLDMVVSQFESSSPQFFIIIFPPPFTGIPLRVDTHFLQTCRVFCSAVTAEHRIWTDDSRHFKGRLHRTPETASCSAQCSARGEIHGKLKGIPNLILQVRHSY